MFRNLFKVAVKTAQEEFVPAGRQSSRGPTASRHIYTLASFPLLHALAVVALSLSLAATASIFCSCGLFGRFAIIFYIPVFSVVTAATAATRPLACSDTSQWYGA